MKHWTYLVIAQSFAMMPCTGSALSSVVGSWTHRWKRTSVLNFKPWKQLDTYVIVDKKYETDGEIQDRQMALLALSLNISFLNIPWQGAEATEVTEVLPNLLGSNRLSLCRKCDGKVWKKSPLSVHKIPSRCTSDSPWRWIEDDEVI